MGIKSSLRVLSVLGLGLGLDQQRVLWVLSLGQPWALSSHEVTTGGSTALEQQLESTIKVTHLWLRRAPAS